MKAVKVIKSPEAFQLLADDTRRRIIHLLRAKERTVSQIAEELGLTPQAIYHHIRKMKDADLIEIAREERVDHFIETYYRASAEVFHLSHGEGQSKKLEEQQVVDALQNLSKIGIEIQSDPEMASRVIAIQRKMAKIGGKESLADRVAGLDGVDFFGTQALIEYAGYLLMSDEDFEEYLDLQKQLRKLLKSKLVRPAQLRKKA